jgi:hypothetical protein
MAHQEVTLMSSTKPTPTLRTLMGSVAATHPRSPVVVITHGEPHSGQRMLHRADCYHLTVPNPGAEPSVVRPATLHEARTLPVCMHCDRAEQREETGR